MYPTEALRQVWAEASAAPERAGVRGVLLDLRRSASLVRRPVAELRQVTGYFAIELARDDLSCALLVKGAVRYGLMRMVASWVPGGVRVRVFRDGGEALTWLRTTPMGIGG